MESTTNGYAALEGPRSADMPVPASRLPEPQTPMDDLWAIKAAMDMVRDRLLSAGCAHVPDRSGRTGASGNAPGTPVSGSPSKQLWKA